MKKIDAVVLNAFLGVKTIKNNKPKNFLISGSDDTYYRSVAALARSLNLTAYYLNKKIGDKKIFFIDAVKYTIK
jgi:hypothetical protein